MGNKQNSKISDPSPDKQSPLKSKFNGDILAKSVMIGHEMVGKSALLIKHCNNDITETYIATIGVDIKVLTIECETRRVKMQVWDAAGQDRFKNVRNAYLKGASGIYLCYDTTSQLTFDIINQWLKDNHDKYKSIAKVLVATKYDAFDRRRVSYKKGEQLANEYDMPFLETSIYCDNDEMMINNNDKLINEEIVYGYIRIQREMLLPSETRYNITELIMKCCLEYYSLSKCVSASVVFHTMANQIVKKFDESR